MRWRILIYIAIILFISALQPTLLGYLEIFGVKPNLFLVFTISVALLRGNIEGACVGFFTGLSQDILSGKVLGVYALLGLYFGLLTGTVNKRLYRENILVIIFFTLISTVTYEFIVYGAGILLPALSRGVNPDVAYALKNIIAPEAAYNCLLSIFVYLFVAKLNRKFEAADLARKY